RRPGARRARGSPRQQESSTFASPLPHTRGHPSNAMWPNRLRSPAPPANPFGHRAPCVGAMRSTRILLGIPLLLGALVLVSGLALATGPDMQNAVCRKTRMMWGSDNPTPPPGYMVYQAFST